MSLNIGHPAGPTEAQEEALAGRTLANHAARGSHDQGEAASKSSRDFKYRGQCNRFSLKQK
jgi:hypothetical protein